MKFDNFLISLLVVGSGAALLGPQRQQPQAPITPSRQSSSLNSHNTASSLESNTQPKSKWHFPGILKFDHKPDFQCHSFPPEKILSDLAIYITELLRSYCDELCSKKGEDSVHFDTCLGGSRPDDVSPSIYFSSTTTTKRQMSRVRKLLENDMVRNFPSVEVIASSKGIALVQRKNNELNRRNTI